MDDRINSHDISAVIFLLIVGMTMLFGFDKTVGSYKWVSALIGSLVGALIFLCCNRLLQLYPNMNIFQIFKEVLGNKIGIIVSCIYIIAAVFMGVIAVNLFTEFCVITALRNTSKTIIVLTFILVIIFSCSFGRNTIFNASRIICPVVAVSVIFTIILAWKHYDFAVLTIERVKSVKELILASGLSINRIFAPIVFVFTICRIDKNEKKWSLRVWISYIISVLFVAIVLFRNASILGDKMVAEFYFPSYSATSVLEFGELLERLEIMVSISYMLTSIVQAVIFIMSASVGTAELTKKDYRIFAVIYGVMVAILSLTVFESTMHFFNVIENIMPYSFWVLGLLPIIMWPIAEIKTMRGQLKRLENK